MTSDAVTRGQVDALFVRRGRHAAHALERRRRLERLFADHPVGNFIPGPDEWRAGLDPAGYRSAHLRRVARDVERAALLTALEEFEHELDWRRDLRRRRRIRRLNEAAAAAAERDRWRTDGCDA